MQDLNENTFFFFFKLSESARLADVVANKKKTQKVL